MQKAVWLSKEALEIITQYQEKSNCSFNKAVNILITSNKDTQELELLQKIFSNQKAIYNLLKK